MKPQDLAALRLAAQLSRPWYLTPVGVVLLALNVASAAFHLGLGYAVCRAGPRPPTVGCVVRATLVPGWPNADAP